MVDTSDFIRDSRHRLEQDKGRLMRPYVSGILPSDEGRAALNDEKRRQRQEEYLSFLKNQTQKPFHNDKPKSVTDLRRELSRERDRELRKPTFNEPHKKEWEDDERDLMSWMRDKRRVKEHTRSSSSAPVFPGLNIKGREEIEKEKRERQNQYRSELQAQMREREQLRDVNGRQILPHRREFTRSPELLQKPHHKKRSPPSSPPLSPSHDHSRKREDRKNKDNIEKYKPDYHDYHGYYNHPPHSYPHPPPHSHPPPPHFIPPYTTHGPYSSHTPYYYPPYPPYMPRHFAPPIYVDEYRDEYPSRNRRHRSPTSSRRGDKTPPSRSPSPEEEKPKRNRDHLKPILTKKDKKDREREKFIKKMETEIYDPWGRPGAGAPLTDATGNLVTERGLLRKSFDELSPRLSEEEKKRLQQEKQKLDLERQIKEKEEKALKEKLTKQQEDIHEEQRIRDEMNRLHIQAQSEKENEKEKERGAIKEETIVKAPPTPLYSKQELAELKFKEELEKKKRQEEEKQKRLDKLADKLTSGNSPFQYNNRSNSPPLPALLSSRTKSPPIPTLRNNKPEETTPTFAPPTPVPPTLAPPTIPRVITTPPNDIQHTMEPVTFPIDPPTNIVPNIYQTSCEPSISPSPYEEDDVVVRLPVANTTNSNRGETRDILQNLSSLKDGLRRKFPHAQSSSNTQTHSMYLQTHTTLYPQTHTSSYPQTHTTYPQTELYHANPHISSTYNPYSQSRTSTHPQPHTSVHPQSHTSTHSHPPIRLKPSIPRPRVPSQAPLPPSNTIDKFNSIKYAAPTTSLVSFWKQYPEPPKTNSDLEIQQDALLLHQRQHRDREAHSPPPRLPSSQSRATINTIDIEHVAARNEERKRKLQSILNARRRSSANANANVNSSSAEDGVTSIPSGVSLDCETIQFHPPSSPPNVQ